MAATRILFESFTRAPLNPFNREPYHLGGFDQIAHYRGGSPGRAKSFSLELTAQAPSEITSQRQQRRMPPRETQHKFTFVRGTPQPELSEYEFSMSGIVVTLSMDKEVIVKIAKDGRDVLQIKPEGAPPPILLRKELSYLQFAFQSLSFGSANKEIVEHPALRDHISTLTQVFQQSIQYVRKSVFASAPIRSEPLRTYNPSEVLASAEGAHVPLEMARQRIESPERWEKVHEKLAQFGASSGLFDDIDIRQLGKKDGDPFQITVSTGGPKMNIVDVGYGVSQALPIIYQLENAQGYDTYLLQQPEIHLHPRAQAELGSLLARISKQRAGTLHLIETHSDYIIDRVRMEVARGYLDPAMVTIVFFDKTEHSVTPSNIFLSKDGEIINPPDSYRAFFLEEQQRLLGL